MQLDKHHLILYGVIALAVFFGSWAIADHRAHQSDIAAAIANERAVAADKLNLQLQVQTATQLKALADANAALQAQVTGLQQAMSARNIALVTQKKTDAALPPSDLAARWNWIIKIPEAAKPTEKGFEVTPEGAVATVQSLDELLALRDDKKDLSSVVSHLNEVISNDAAALDAEKKAHDSDNATCKIDLKAKDATIKQVKDDAARDKHKWGVVGAIVGFIVRGFVH